MGHAADLYAVRPLDPACGNCGYSLLGLPAAGKCPECGEPYTDEVIVVRGWGWGKRESIANAAPNRILILVAICLAAAVFLLIRGSRSGFILLGVLMVVWAVLGLQRWRLISDFGVTCHARLSAEGFGQRDGFGPVEIIPWLNIGDYELIQVDRKRHRLRIASQLPEADRVSIEFACTEPQAAWLSEAIVRLRRISDVTRITS